MAIMSAAFGALVRRVGAARLRTIGLLVSTSGATALALVAVAHHSGHAPTPVVWTLLAVAVAGMGWCIPGTTAIAQLAGRRFGGAASALQGGATFVVGAFATPLTGQIGHQSVLAMAVLMTALFTLAVTALLVTTRAGNARR